jgi:RNA recognition motif-containing protein
VPKRLFISNVPSHATSTHLRTLFESQAIGVLRAWVCKDWLTGRTRGFGFVDIARASDVDRAIRMLDGIDLDGHMLAVSAVVPEAELAGARMDAK